MRSSMIVLSLAVAMAGVLGAGVAEASVVKKTVPDLILDSDLVVHGKVTGQVSYWQDGIIVTEFTVSVKSPIIGAAFGDVPVIVQGGIVGNIGLHVSDQPDLRRGGEMVLFLEHVGGGDHIVAGAWQGQVTVRKNRVPAFDMPLDEFIAQVQNGGIELEENPAKPDNPGGGKGGGGKGGGEEVCYKLCKLDWRANGEDDGTKYSPKLENSGTSNWHINIPIPENWSDAELEAELGAAADVWNLDANACWSIGTMGTTTHDSGLTGAAFDGDNTITFGDTGSSVAVVSNWFYRNARKNTIETDLTFNDVDWDYGIDVCGSNSLFDLLEIAVHEFGHWICLGDQYEDSNSANTMYGYVDFGECHKQTLESCDVSGAKAVYGECLP